MRSADKEDQQEAMQKANPMRESIVDNPVRERKVDSILHDSEAKLTPAPPKPPVGKAHFGRTIEVQTDLSMVTME